MTDAYVRLLCPTCRKAWEVVPGDLPEPEATMQCPDCGETDPASQFTRTKREFEILDTFHSA